MKLNNVLLVGLLLRTLSISSQLVNEPCVFDRLINNRKIIQSEKIIQDGANLRSNHYIKLILVVVHVFHLNGAENISNAQIESQITVLNEDYGKLAGTNGDGNGVDAKVRFF